MSYLKIFFVCFALVLTTLSTEARKKIDPEALRTARDLQNRFTCLRSLSATARELGMPHNEQSFKVAEKANLSCNFCGTEDYLTTHPMIWRRANGKDVYVSIIEVQGVNLKKKAPVVSLLEYDRVFSGNVCLVNKKQKQLARTFTVESNGNIAFDDNDFQPKRCNTRSPAKGYTHVQPRALEDEEASNKQASLFAELDAEIERMINYANYDRIKTTVEKRSNWRERGQGSKSPFFVGRDQFAPPACDQAVTRRDLKDRLEQAREDIVNLSKWSRDIERISEGYITEKNNAALSGKKKGSVTRRENPPAPAPATLEGSYATPASAPTNSESSQGTN